jgi:hypothetical protein
MSDLACRLQEKIKTLKQQIEDAEEIAALNLAKFRKAQQGSILQNSVSAENFSDKFSSTNFRRICIQKSYILIRVNITYGYIALSFKAF